MLTRRTLIQAGLETTEGTEVVLGATTSLLALATPATRNEGEVLLRDIVRQNFSRLGHVIGIRQGGVQLQTEFRGIDAIPTAAAPLRENPLYLACGMSPTYAASSCVYRPLTDFGALVNSCTIYAYLDGLLHVYIGCRGTFSVEGSVGQYGRINWNMSGTFAVISTTPAATDGIRNAAFPSPTYQAALVNPPPWLSCTFTINGYAGIAQALSFDINNTISPREDFTQANGVRSYLITGRDPNGTVNPESVDRGTGANPAQDFWGRWANGTKGVLAFAVGTPVATGDGKVAIDMPAIQLGQLTYGDRAGLRVFEAPYSCNATSDTVEDEVSISYS